MRWPGFWSVRVRRLPVLTKPGDDAVDTARRYNVKLTRGVLDESLNEVRALALPVSGSGLLMRGIEPLVFLALAEGMEEKCGPLQDFVWQWYVHMGEKPAKDGKVIKSKAGGMAQIGESIEQLLEFRVPLWPSAEGALKRLRHGQCRSDKNAMPPTPLPAAR